MDATPQRRARQWLANLAELQQSGTSEEFLESVKVDLFPDKIYVFTPKGDIMPLPKGATTVDFAYAVHTDIGNRCVAAKVDRVLVPLRTELHNGQTVEVITEPRRKTESELVEFRTHRQSAHGDPQSHEEHALESNPSTSAGACSIAH